MSVTNEKYGMQRVKKVFGLICLITSFWACKSSGDEHNENTLQTQYAMGIVFRETPFADIRGAKLVDSNAAKNRKHFELDYNKEGRLVECRYVLNGELVAFSDRFVRAPKIEILYQNNQEVRRFYDVYGNRTLVSGDVYEVHILHNGNGERSQLTFHNVNGEVIENDFGIAKYIWKRLPNGDVMEWRYDTKNELVRNRPGFEYLITQFSYDENGLLTQMINMGMEGKTPFADEAGVIATKIKYNEEGQFTEWANYDIDDNLIRGMSNIAKISYKPSPFAIEQEAIFLDANNQPQSTNWGAHKVLYTFDAVGNETERRFRDVEDSPTNANSGVGIIKSTYTPEGKHQVTRAYFNKDGDPIGLGDNNVHVYKTDFDTKNRPVQSSYYNVEGKLVNGSGGYATEQLIFDGKGRMMERRYLDSEGNLVDNANIGVARFEYLYKNEKELEAVNTYTSAGNITKPNWNPNH